jgi:hypothetical protein
MYAITDSTCQDILRSLCGLLFKQTVRRLVLQEQRRQQRLTDSSGGLPPFSPLPPVQTNQVWGLQEQKRQQRGIRSHHEDTKAQSSGPPDQRFFSVSPCLCGSKPPGLSAVGQSLLPLRPPVPTNRRTIGFTGTEETESWAPGSNSSGALPPFSPSPPVQNKTVRRLVLPEHAEAAEDDKLMG